jgi:general L-amino acid transport system permease protein
MHKRQLIAWGWQILACAGVAALIFLFAHDARENLATRHIATGFHFLSQTAPIPIGETPIAYTPSVSTYGRAFLIGVLNTLKVALPGCVVATLWGTAVGLARLSRIPLLSRLAAAYVQGLRNVPLLLQLFFWYGIAELLPPPRQALELLPGVFLSNRGLVFPALSGSGALFLAALVFLAAWVGLPRLFAKAAPAKHALVLRAGGAAALGALTLVALSPHFAVDPPVLRGFNFRGGVSLSPEYVALFTGLVLYTASYIAEIVRGGLLAIPRGQWEAGRALGFSEASVLRLVVLPQTLRIVIPPMISQYLNLLKNSSLAVAIGYQDLASITETILNQTGQAIEAIALMMAVYLGLSLSVSLALNLFDARLKRERGS